MSGDPAKRGARAWLPALAAVLAAVVATIAGCHDLDLARLRCSTAGRCPDGYSCADGFCTQNADGGGTATAQQGPPGAKNQGAACQNAGDCASKSCVDGVCCNTSCLDACHACNLPNNVGTCVAVARGQEPVHGDCAKQDPATCGTNGLCDGAGACQRYDDKTVCRKASCDAAANAVTPQARCDGNGSCVAADAPISCAPFVCKPDGRGCADSCGDSSTCVAPAVCTGGSCGKIGNGLPCHDASQCQSGFCADGVCCNTACGEQCMACDVTGSLGTCAQVPSGSPHGGRAPCAAADPLCGGQCTPASAITCTYPGLETVCGSATCKNNGRMSATVTAPASCDGRGGCGAGLTANCGAFLCGPSGSCATTCAGDPECVDGNTCVGGQCRPKGMAAAPCTSNNQCAAGLTCTDGVCCDGKCDQPCHSCNLPGQAGHCAVVASADDPDSCADPRSCDATGACKVKPQQPCSSSADCAAGSACTTFYPDADGDGYGDKSATLANGQAKAFCGLPPAGNWATSNTDCCDAGDTLKQVHPGQTGWFIVPGPCGIQFDYDCDGIPTSQYMAGGACSDAACTPGFTAAVACGASGDYQSCDAAALACVVTVPTVQGCR
jgi:hypothetical protein